MFNFEAIFSCKKQNVSFLFNPIVMKFFSSRYFYVTMLRDPIQRYLSEWKQVQRGGTWMSTKLKCNGRQATLLEVPFCFKGNTLRTHLPHCL